MNRLAMSLVCACALGCTTFRAPLPGSQVGSDAGNESDADALDALVFEDAGGNDASNDAAFADADVDANTAPTGGSSGEAGTGGGSGIGGGVGGESGSGGTGGTAPVCECDTVSDCCDGCDFTHVCDALRVEPQCQASMCADVAGCSFVNAREALSCDDGNADTRNDRCHAGACVGEPRQCSSGPCCDGWLFKGAEVRCAVAAPNFTVVNGMAVHKDGGRVFECQSSDCRGRIWESPHDVYCSGSSPACDGAFGDDTGVWARGPMECGAGFKCNVGAAVSRDVANADFRELCIAAPSCN